jgi:class 3 adenylate cyclase
MDRMSGALLESTVANLLLSALGDNPVRQRRSTPDFEIERADGSRTLVEVKADIGGVAQISRLASSVEKAIEPNDRFILVTPEAPAPGQEQLFSEAFSKLPISCKWLGIQDLPMELGIPSPGDFDSPNTLAHLQVAALVGNMARYDGSPIGSGVGIGQSLGDDQLAYLSRQLSFSDLNTLSKANGALDDNFRFGQRVEQVTVVLTDIVNFSSLVGASRPEDLKEAMSRYYRLARDAVFRHGGMLDKFIGDAVLAVFGYPVSKERDAVSAIQFAQELISIGQEVLGEWRKELNADIDSGTRVGIATGDLWPINIGSAQVEVTLLGDMINLAARLEKNCPRDRLLIDNRTKSKAGREDETYVAGLDLKYRKISPGDAKGQQFDLQTWETA